MCCITTIIISDTLTITVVSDTLTTTVVSDTLTIVSDTLTTTVVKTITATQSFLFVGLRAGLLEKLWMNFCDILCSSRLSRQQLFRFWV